MAQAPWSVKGIDPKARAAAKTAARKKGMTLGEWLNRVILEDGERPAPTVWNEDSNKFTGFEGEDGENSAGALRAAIERLTERVNRAEQISQDGQSALEALIGEGNGNATQTLDDLSEQTADLERRLDIADAQLSRTSRQTVSTEDFRRRFEGLASELASAILATRNQFTRELDSISSGQSDSRLSEKLQTVDARLQDAERRQSTKLKMIGTQLELLAGAMQRDVEDVTTSLEDRVSHLETMTGAETTPPVSQQISKLRHDHSSAIGRIGEEISRLGSALVNRIEDVETRSAAAIEATGNKVADVVEKLDVSQTAPVKKLEERIVESEKRTARHLANAMETVHGRLEEVRTEHDQALTPVQKTMTSLAERLKAIETRALEEGLDVRLDIPDPIAIRKMTEASVATGIKSDLSLPREDHTRAKARIVRNEDKSTQSLSADEEALFEPLEFDPEPGRDTASDKPIESFTNQSNENEDSEDQTFDIEVHSGRASGSSNSETAESETSVSETSVSGDDVVAEPVLPKKPAVIGATADADFLATMRARAKAQDEEEKTHRPSLRMRRSDDTKRQTRSETTRPKRQSETSSHTSSRMMGGDGRLLLAGTSVLSFAVIGIAASLLIADAVTGSNDEGQVLADADLSSLFADQSAITIEPAAPALEAPIDTIESSVRDTDIAPINLTDEFTQGDPVARYQMALSQLADGNLEDGTALMRRAAEQGLTPAQYRYGLMLQRGEGVDANPAEARDWIVQAAEAGHVRAMHMAGSMYISAAATPENQTLAAYWFEEAALHGHQNGQFNLGVLYEEGFGVPVSPGDAYAWFLVAERSGDSDAGDRARDLAPSLTTQQRNEARNFAATFQPEPVDLAIQGNLEAMQALRTSSLSQVQRVEELLTQMGYTAGPVDGSLDPQTREAIISYQTDRGLAQTGTVDVALLASLEQTATQ